jgi:hypothetical protein
VILQGIGTAASQLPGSFFSAYDGRGQLLCASDCTSNSTGSSDGGLGGGSVDSGKARKEILGIVAVCAAVVIPLLSATFGLYLLAKKIPAFRSRLAYILPEVCLPSLPAQGNMGNVGNVEISGPGSRLRDGHEAVGALGAMSLCLWQQRSESNSQRKVVLSSFAFAESNDATATAFQVEQDHQPRSVAKYASRRWSLSSTAISAAKLDRSPDLAHDGEKGRILFPGAIFPSPAPFWTAKDQLSEMLETDSRSNTSSRIAGGDRGSSKSTRPLHSDDNNVKPKLNLDLKDADSDNTVMSCQPTESGNDSLQLQLQWRRGFLAAAKQSAAFSRACRMAEDQSSMLQSTPASVAAADGLGLLAASATTAARRESEATLLRLNPQGVHAECLWPRHWALPSAPVPSGPSRINSTSCCSNTKKYTAALSSGIDLRSSANCGGALPSKRGVGQVTATGGARLVEAGLPPMTRWGDDVVGPPAATAASAPAVAHLQFAPAIILSRSAAVAPAPGSQTGIDISLSPRDSAQRFPRSSDLALVGGFSRDLRTPLEDLRASGISSNISGNFRVSGSANGQLHPPAFREILHRHYAASVIPTGSRSLRRHGSVAFPLTVNALVGQDRQARTSPR